MSTSGARAGSSTAATGISEDEVRGTTVDELLDALNRGSDALAERTAELREVQAQSLTPREHARMLTLLTSATGVDRLKRMLDVQTSDRTGQAKGSVLPSFSRCPPCELTSCCPSSLANYNIQVIL